MRLQRIYGITDIDQCVIDYCKDIYDVTITEFTIQNHTYLKLEIESDIFKVNLSDKIRFGEYTFFHQNSREDDNGQKYYHVQLKVKNFGFGIYACCTHFQKHLGISYNKKDWIKFREDAIKYKMNSKG